MKHYDVVALAWTLTIILLLAACQSGTATANPSRPLPTTAPTARPLPAGPTPDDTPEAAAATAVEEATVAPQVATATVMVQATRPPLGTAERPVQLLFPPVAAAAVITQRTQALVDALEATTDAEFVVGVPDSEEVAVELLCSAPADTIGFISAVAYTVAQDQCGAQPGLVARHSDDLTWQMGMIVIRPGDATDLGDLAGKRWAVSDTRSMANYLYFRAKMVEAGIEPGEIVTTAEDSSALMALYDGEVDLTTADFVPPIMPQGREWVYGETEPEEWRALGVSPTRSPIGYVLVAAEPDFGGYRLRDARSRLFDTTPAIFDRTRILALSEPIPNETVVFGADFPEDLARQTLATMADFAASEACQTSFCSADFYGWSGLEPADDAAYDPIRFVKDTLELEATDLWAELD